MTKRLIAPKVLQTFSTEDHIAEFLKLRVPKLGKCNCEVTVANVGARVMLPKRGDFQQKKVVIFLAVISYAFRDQISWIEVAPHQETLRHTIVLQLRNGLRGPDKKPWRC